MKKIIKYFLKENLILLVITVIFSIVLFLFSFMTVINYSYSMENEFITGINSSLVEEIRTSIANGKSMDKYYGLEALLNKSVKIIGDDCVIFAYDKKDQLCGCSNPAVYPFDTKGYKEVCIDIESSVGDKEGSLSVYYPKKRIIDTIIPSAIQGAVGSAIILVIIVFVFSLLLIKMVCSQRRAMLVIVGGIIIQGLLCTYLYAGIFRDSAEKNIYGIAEYLGNSMIAMEEKGIQLNDISDIDEYLEKEVEKYEWVKKIYLSKDITTSSGEAYVLKISDDDNLNVVFDISKKYITKRVLQMLLAFFATVILAIIVMVETLPLSDLIIFRRTAKYDSRNPMQYEFAASSLRLTNFLMSTFSYICLSFAALQIKEWNRGIGGISPQIASALSVSLCTLAEAVGMIIVPLFFSKMNRKRLLIGSSLLMIVSNFACFFATSPLVLILMRIFTGFGFAGNKQVNNDFITSCYESDEEKQKNLAESNSGIIGGILCGMGLGSIIADIFGYNATFLVAGVGLIMYLLVNLLFVPWKVLFEYTQRDTANIKQQLVGIGKLLTSLDVWKKMVLVVTPQYFFLIIIVTLIPGRVQSAGMDGNVLTYANLLNGIFGLYIGGYIGKFLIEKFGKAKTLGMVFVGGVVSMLIIDLPLPVVMILLSAVISGLLDGVGTPISTDLFLESEALKSNVDEGIGLMLYTITGSIIMTIAPIVLEMCEKNQIVMIVVCAVLLVIAIPSLRVKKMK